MGLCISKTTASLAPSARVLSVEEARQGAEGSATQSPIWGERTLASGTKVKTDSMLRSVGANLLSKGYMELGSKGEGEPQMSREAEEEADTDGDELENLLNFSDSVESLRSEFLE